MLNPAFVSPHLNLFGTSFVAEAIALAYRPFVTSATTEVVAPIASAAAGIAVPAIMTSVYLTPYEVGAAAEFAVPAIMTSVNLPPYEAGAVAEFAVPAIMTSVNLTPYEAGAATEFAVPATVTSVNLAPYGAGAAAEFAVPATVIGVQAASCNAGADVGNLITIKTSCLFFNTRKRGLKNFFH